MDITVNNQSFTLESSASVTQLLAVILGVPESGIAVAVNQKIVSRTVWPDYFLEPGDQVVLIKATQGG